MPPPVTPHFDIPFRLGQYGMVCVEQGSFEEIADCVEVIVRTPLGFRSDIPEFGFPELEFDVQPTTGPDIVELITTQEPRAQVVVSDRPDAFDDLINRVLVDVRGVTQVP